MLDHLGLDVADYERGKAFYARALAPLGIKLIMKPVAEVGGFGDGHGARQSSACPVARRAARRRGHRLRTGRVPRGDARRGGRGSRADQGRHLLEL